MCVYGRVCACVQCVCICAMIIVYELLSVLQCCTTVIPSCKKLMKVANKKT